MTEEREWSSVNTRPVSEPPADADVSFSRPRSTSFLEADSEPPKGFTDPESFFLKKCSLDEVKQEMEKYAMSQGDSSEVIKLWILKQIDHWNNDHEMVVILTRDYLYLVKYDFVTRRRRGQPQCIQLSQITSVTRGDIVYPQYSVMARRQNQALKLVWGQLETLSYRQKWNPLCRTLPYCVLASHPLYGVETTSENASRLNLDDFTQTILQAIQAHTSDITLTEEPIVINSYVNVGSLVFNQSQLGFSKDRKGISF